MLEELVVALIKNVPTFAEWIGKVVGGSSADDPVSRRVREILPEQSASAEVAEELRGRP